MSKANPDFILIGAMKCGTTTLAAQLGAQSGIFITTPKEPNFFSDDAIYARGVDWYGALYKGAGAGDLTGEASTHYTKLPTYPQTIARLQSARIAPRLIYMIRDPLDRLISHYIHEWTQGVISCPLDEALEKHPELCAYSRYGEQIAPWCDAFGAQNILVMTMEEMKQDPQRVLDKAAAHLGQAGLTWCDDLQQMNVSAERIRRLPLHGVIFDNPLARWLRRALVPQSVRDRLKAGRQMQNRPKLSPEDRARLTAGFRADQSRLKALFPDNDSLDMAYKKFAP
ncbi:sulfotransferase [Litorivita sp. NS0012-18]|uniref:sulfotransferase family protein n=1 Tax=Litorivita sp. NS0012-18 TaxID=3127655 RepID=UPI00310A3021